MIRCVIALLIVFISSPSLSYATIIGYTDKQEWQNAVGAHTTITFQEFPVGTWVSDHYGDLGITFDLSANFYSQIQDFPLFLNDGVGLKSFGLSGSPVVRFQGPTYAIAVDAPISITNFWLYNQDAFVGNITVTSAGYFKGIISTLPFDTVLFLPTSIDDLYFGPPIPAPGGIGVLGASLLCGWRRRRRI